ncbi:MAG: hypothetical protein AABZ60_24405 [Planctomycetota bacterium]
MKNFSLLFVALLLVAHPLFSQNQSITLKSPADKATGVSVLPTFEFDFSKDPSPPIMFQIASQGAPVYMAVIMTPAKSFKFKLFDPSVQGGGTISMTGRLEPETAYTWEVSSGGTIKKSASFMTGKLDVQAENPMLKMMIASMKSPYKLGPLGEELTDGEWAEYSVGSGVTYRMAVVGQDGENCWIEMTYKMSAQNLEYVMKFLVDDSDDHKVLKAYAGAIGGKGTEIGISDASTDPEKSEEYDYKSADLAAETITIDAGVFSCSVKQTTVSKKDGSFTSVSKSYISTNVPLSGMVKTTSDVTMKGGMKSTSEIVLVGKGSDAKSELQTE